LAHQIIISTSAIDAIDSDEKDSDNDDSFLPFMVNSFLKDISPKVSFLEDFQEFAPDEEH